MDGNFPLLAASSSWNCHWGQVNCSVVMPNEACLASALQVASIVKDNIPLSLSSLIQVFSHCLLSQNCTCYADSNKEACRAILFWPGILSSMADLYSKFLEQCKLSMKERTCVDLDAFVKHSDRHLPVKLLQVYLISPLLIYHNFDLMK